MRTLLVLWLSLLGLAAQPLAGFQEARTFRPGQAIPVAPGRGWLLELGPEVP